MYERCGGCLVESFESWVCCLFKVPFLNEEGGRVHGAEPGATVDLLFVFVFENEQIIADACAYHMNDRSLFNPLIFAYLEKESDWLYWEMEILGELLHGENFAPSASRAKIKSDNEVLLYSNMYVSLAYRRKGIARHMLAMMESFASGKSERYAVCSCISLDPDLPCYGPDQAEFPYVYSMKDEPARLLNAQIIEKLGFEALRLETDEEVEDGSLLWFAVRKQEYMYI